LVQGIGGGSLERSVRLFLTTCSRPTMRCLQVSSPCENAKTLDRDRTSYLFNAALAAKAASSFNFEIEPENIILVALRVFEFSHSLGPKRPTGIGRVYVFGRVIVSIWWPVLALYGFPPPWD
jgi:hypothetical protein